MEHYSTLASLFSYPDEELTGKVTQAREIILEHYPESLEDIDTFLSFLKATSIEKQSEYYIKTFDVQAVCYLDIGYILFGEDYKRGEFLVRLQNEHKQAKNDCGTELADHLPNVLRLLPKIADPGFAEELGYCLIIPALKEMLKNFKEEENVYRKNLVILLHIMETDFQGLDYPQFLINNKVKTDFLKQLNV